MLVCQLLDQVAHCWIASLCAHHELDLALVVEEYFQTTSEEEATVSCARQYTPPPTQILR